MAPSRVLLPGLDGSSPLGFLAALGLLRLLDEARAPGAAQPRLSWTERGGWVATLHGPSSIDEVVERAMTDLQAWDADPLFGFRYLKAEKRGTKPFAGIQAPAAVLRAWLRTRLEARDRRSLDYASCLMSETATEAVKPAKQLSPADLAAAGIPYDPSAPLDRVTIPTAFDFTSRNVQFLDQVRLLRETITPEVMKADITEARPVPGDARTLSWNPAADAPAAMYAVSRAGHRPASEWLTFRGLVWFPVFGAAGRLQTTGCRGRRKEGRFVWAVWCPPATPRSIRSLVAYARLEETETRERLALGITQVFSAALTKAVDGYDGVFSPAAPEGGISIPQATETSHETLPGAAAPGTPVIPPSAAGRSQPLPVDWTFEDDP